LDLRVGERKQIDHDAAERGQVLRSDFANLLNKKRQKEKSDRKGAGSFVTSLGKNLVESAEKQTPWKVDRSFLP
jgi:hypothetical protein